VLYPGEKTEVTRSPSAHLLKDGVRTSRERSLRDHALVRDCCLCLHVQRAARALARRFDKAVRPPDITNGQFSLLKSLNRPKPPGMGAVAPLLAMDRTTLTAALKPLKRRGLIKVSADPHYRRGRLLAMTPKGKHLLASAGPIWERKHKEI
jgi:DNA-binding MarR family transcriptional regulator